ncbi:MAG: DEAD/DEAH box helicase [Desulfobacteraceae bacterium]|nr:MAG: DEAD/DEAH box helicase [Desulfobacteraceae bacterium]
MRRPTLHPHRISRRRNPKPFRPEPIRPEADSKLKRIFAEIGVPKAGPFVPDPFQLEALAAVRHSDCLVTAPTGAGKTWIAEQAILERFKQGKKAWYASPLKALSNSKHAEFSASFGPENVGILTGDRKENPEAPITVGTTEILRNQLYDAMHHGVSLETDFVVLDEAHFLGDAERGVVWEEIMIYLPARIPILMLSATIGNAPDIAGWLSSIRKRDCVVVEEKKRPVPLVPLFLHPSGMLLPLLSQERSKRRSRLDKKVGSYLSVKNPPLLAPPGKLPPFGQILRVLRRFRLLPAIFFLKSRADCDQALELCMNNRIQDYGRRADLQNRIESLLSENPYMAGHRQRWHLENLAVGAHHSGQLPAWKLVLETLMTEGRLDAVFATSTVAAGVNFPARTVSFLNSDRFNGIDFAPLTPTEFHQMTGRAGRRGMDRVGFAVALPGKFMDIPLIARLMGSPPTPVLSQIRINFSMVLNLLLSHTPEQIRGLLENSFAAYLLLQKGEKQRNPASKEDRLLLWKDFLRHLRFLKKNGFVASNGELTDDGRWASRLRIDQPLLVAEGLRLGIFPDSDPALLAAMVATFVSDRDFDDRLNEKLVSRPLVKVFFKMRDELKPLTEDLEAEGFATRPFFLRPAATVFAWAAGQEWDEVRSAYEIEEGDLAMLILRTADNLRHIYNVSEAFPAISASAAQAIELILREPVVTEAL